MVKSNTQSTNSQQGMIFGNEFLELKIKFVIIYSDSRNDFVTFMHIKYYNIKHTVQCTFTRQQNFKILRAILLFIF